MNRFKALFLAVLMMVSIVFVAGSIGDGSFSTSAQTTTTRRHRRNGIASRSYRGGKYVAHKTVRGTRYVAHKTKRGAKYVGRKTYKTSRKVVSRTKKIVQ